MNTSTALVELEEPAPRALLFLSSRPMNSATGITSLVNPKRPLEPQAPIAQLETIDPAVALVVAHVAQVDLLQSDLNAAEKTRRRLLDLADALNGLSGKIVSHELISGPPIEVKNDPHLAPLKEAKRDRLHAPSTNDLNSARAKVAANVALLPVSAMVAVVDQARVSLHEQEIALDPISVMAVTREVLSRTIVVAQAQAPQAARVFLLDASSERNLQNGQMVVSLAHRLAQNLGKKENLRASAAVAAEGAEPRETVEVTLAVADPAVDFPIANR